MYTEKAGQLYVGTTRDGGKEFDVWQFMSPFDGRDGQPKLPKFEVKVYVHKTTKTGIYFEARGVNLAENLQDTDIEVLRAKVETALRTQHDLLAGTSWEDWLEIKVTGERTYDQPFWGTKANVSLEVFKMKRAVDPATGHAYVVNNNGSASPFPLPKKAGELDPGETRSAFKGLSRRDQDAEYSYLPATPENIAALDDLMDRVNELRRRMSDFLGQDNVGTSLANIANGVAALPAPI